MIDLFGNETAGATFSPCRTWRYTLTRRWGSGPHCQFIGLNPSTATETEDDPTIRRCIRFARDWGYAALVMTNLFGLRSTDPRGLRKVADPVGPENDRYLIEIGRQAGIVIAAWGIHGMYQRRDLAVLDLLADQGVTLHCLGMTQGGFPKHPLYLPANSRPTGYHSSARSAR